jgi:hypothetical protein
MTYKRTSLTCVVSGCCLSVWLIIGLCLYYVGYPRYGLINESLRPVEAEIIGETDIYHPCIYSCNCNSKGSCQTCTRPCWDHYLYFAYTPNSTIDYNSGESTTGLFMWNDGVPYIVSNYWYVGNIVWVYYNLCAFGPIYHDDIAICQKHGDTNPLYLNLLNQNGMLAGAYSGFVFSGISGVIMIIALCIILIKYLQANPIRMPQVTVDIPLPRVLFHRKVVVITQEPMPPSYNNVIIHWSITSSGLSNSTGRGSKGFRSEIIWPHKWANLKCDCTQYNISYINILS